MNKKIIIYGTLALVILILLFLSYRASSSQKINIDVKRQQLATELEVATTTPENLSHYIEIIDGCDISFVGTCVNLREGPGTKYKVHTRLRTGVVLKVGDIVKVGGQDWYKIIFAAKLLYPERASTDLYVAAGDYLRYFDDIGDEYQVKSSTTTKKILVDVSEQMLYAYDGSVLFMKESISTGLEFTPTPSGTFYIFKKTPSRYMQGPLPGVSSQAYDLPGVPWDLYFTKEGAVIHGAYWHNNFGKPWSHGCVNLSPQNAKKLYEWAVAGTKVIVQN